MKIRKGTEVRAFLCERELEQSKDLIEAINRSEVIQVGCRKNGESNTCAGRCRIILEIKSIKRGSKVKKCL